MSGLSPRNCSKAIMISCPFKPGDAHARPGGLGEVWEGLSMTRPIGAAQDVLETRAGLLRDFPFEALAPVESDAALATKALARARRSPGGRPGPRGGSGTKASRPITSRVVTSRPSASVIGSTSSRSQGNRSPWMGFQRAFIASRGPSVIAVARDQDDRIDTILKYFSQ